MGYSINDTTGECRLYISDANPLPLLPPEWTYLTGKNILNPSVATMVQ